MKSLCHLRPSLVGLLLVVLVIPPRLHAAQPGNPPYTPPWTQEKVKPPEVDDKDKKDTPAAWCGPVTKTKKKTGETWNESKVVYPDGTEIIFQDGGAGGRKIWIITKPGPNNTQIKTTYDNTDPSKPTKTTEETGKPPKSEVWKEAKDAYDAEQKKKGMWEPPTRFARVAVPSYSDGDAFARELSGPFGYSPVRLAATTDRPQQETQATQERPAINIKIVTYGDPPSDTVVHFDPGPQTTPEDFLDTPPTTISWDPKTDGEGPKTIPYKPGGTPVTIEIPGGYINIGWGWTHASVPYSTVQECSDTVDDDDLKEAKRLTDLAKKAREGGPGYWREKARQYHQGAQRAENDGRGPAKQRALQLEEEAKKTADELERRSVPDKPDPKVPQNQQKQVEQQRADAIKKIEDEAAELTRRASTR